MDYIKSHSNYVLKTKHQITKDGTILERDWVTVGGRNDYNENQIPTYDNGNFILTINKDKAPTKKNAENNWFENENGYNWKYDNVKNALSNNESKDNTIVVKSDYFTLQDFAYYGSCSELVRSSLNDILNRFPGELYITDKKPNEDFLSGVTDLYYVENPFNIDIYTTYIVEDEVDDILKYMAANDFSKNYDIYDEKNNLISSDFKISVTYSEPCSNNHIMYECKFSKGNLILKVVTYKGKMYYFGNQKGYHIRPKNTFLSKFYNSLDVFESVILNPFTEPKYKASFQIIYETNNGFKNKLEDYVFPIGNGGYNIGSDAQAYNTYVNKFLKVTDFYDNNFCDNLYRMIVHESIKNFDWTYKYPDDLKEVYLEGGGKIEKLIRLFGREFDEIKFYIDGVKNYNKITYDDRSNIPNYFLTDTLDIEGWNVINIYPTRLVEKNNCNKVYEDLLTTIKPYTNTRLNYPYGYFNTCKNSSYDDGCGCLMYGKSKAKKGDGLYLLEKLENKESSTTYKPEQILRRKIVQYSSEKDYSYKDINSIFFKRLKLNSREILRHKGTIEGIEMMLGMFGLKSKKFCEKYKENKCNTNSVTCVDDKGCAKYDYDITEQISITKGLIDPYFECKDMNRIDWYNSTKSIQYNNANFVNGIYTSYQGLPVIKRINKNDKTIIYPYFNGNNEYDGHPYYQMNGGWLKQSPYVFDINNNIISGDNLYNETLNTTIVVTTPLDLTTIKYDDLQDGQVCIVNNINDEYMIIDGKLYKVYKDYKNYKYISVNINNSSIEIGNLIFNNKIYVSNPYGVCNGSDTNPKVKFYDLSQSENGTEVKLYIYTNETSHVTPKYIIARNDFTPNNSTIDASICTQFYVTNGNFTSDYNEKNVTNYFKIYNKDYKNIFNQSGWQQLLNTDVEYKRIKSIINDFKGNNPHNGNMNYDGGYAYMENFSKLFQYSVNNEYIDYRQYQGTYYKELDYIDQIGFKHLVNENMHSYQTYNDTKVHFFGNWINLNKEKPTYEKYNEEKLSSWYDYNDYKQMFNELDSETKYALKDDNNITITEDADIDGSTHQIVNTKIVNINFYLYPSDETNIFNVKSKNEIKYFQSVIIPYITQMIPSTVILKVNYLMNCNNGNSENSCQITDVKINY